MTAQSALLKSIVSTARLIFAARAASLFLYVEDTDELEFAAVAGYGEDELPGTRLPAGHGITGWVFTTGEPLVLDDVSTDPRFAHDFAAGTGYVPKGMMAFPLLYEGDVSGVLSVLDREASFSLAEMELLGQFATQAAIALEVVRSGERGTLAPELARLVERLQAKGKTGLALAAALADALD